MKNEHIYGLIDGIREEFILEAEPRCLRMLAPEDPPRADASAKILEAPDSGLYRISDGGAKSARAGRRPFKGWMKAACILLAVLFIGTAGMGGIALLGGMDPSGEGGISAIFGASFWQGLFPFLQPDETEPPYEVTVRDPDELTEPEDTRTECEKGNHAWEAVCETDATCYRSGTLSEVCGLCGETRSEEGTKPHTYEDGFCTVCGLAEGAWEQTKFSRAYDGEGNPYAIINQVHGSPEGRIVLPNVYYDEGADQLIPVTEIGKNALSGLDQITEVVVPAAVTCIRTQAFYKCTALERINYPAGLQIMEDYAFDQCTSLLTADLPDSVTQLGYGVFRNCTSLVTAAFPAGLEIIPAGMYGNCKSLTQVQIRGSVTQIGESAFMGCAALTDLPSMPELKAIGSYAFRYCQGLTEITLPETVREVGHYAFAESYNLKKVTFLSPSLTSLLTRVFAGCSALEEVTLPPIVGVFSGQDMFLSCRELSTIYYDGTKDEWKKNYGKSGGLELAGAVKVVGSEETFPLSGSLGT